MRRALIAVTALVVGILGASVAIGVTELGNGASELRSGAPNVVTSASPSPTRPRATATSEASAARAPVEARGLAPGGPAAATVDGDGVDWCAAVRVSGGGARGPFSAEDVRGASCAAVSFVMDKRYSRLALPRRTYQTSSFTFTDGSFAAATAPAYRDRVAAYVARPSSLGADRLGLVLLSSPGPGYRFYGPALSDRGYADRAVWINQTFSPVTVQLDSSRATPRLTVRFSASAAVPVFDTTAARDAMMTVPTSAELVMRREGGAWRIGGWDLRTGDVTHAPLSIR